MKKAIFIVLLVIAANTGFAQITITPEFGYNKSTFFTTAPSSQTSTSPLNGYQFGALVTKTWKGLYFLQTGLQFAQKGSYQGRGSQTPYGSNTDVKLNYLQAPINAGLHIKVYKEFGVNVSAGLYGAYGLSGTDKGTSLDIYGPGSINRKVSFSQTVATADNSKTYIKRFDGGYNLSAGFFYKDIEVKTVYSKSNGNISPVGTSNYKNEVWNVSVGYSFKLK